MNEIEISEINQKYFSDFEKCKFCGKKIMNEDGNRNKGTIAYFKEGKIYLPTIFCSEHCMFKFFEFFLKIKRFKI